MLYCFDLRETALVVARVFDCIAAQPEHHGIQLQEQEEAACEEVEVYSLDYLDQVKSA